VVGRKTNKEEAGPHGPASSLSHTGLATIIVNRYNEYAMPYSVRLLTRSEKTVPFSEITKQGGSLSLVAGTDALWERLEVLEPEDNPIAILERIPVAPGSQGETELDKLRDSIRRSYPANAREWILKYLSQVKTIYLFQLFTDNISKNEWPILGRIQNLLKDSLGGIIQADSEGVYNEKGDYILWQMYESARGAVPAATLDNNGEWISYQLRLDDPGAVELFKQGIPPRRGFLSRLLDR
jgi:hypothetical protein